MATLEQLRDPPIWEVVCGFFFDPIPELDPFVFGAFWKALRPEFPTRELRPAVSDLGIVLAPVPPLRGMLYSTDQAYALQVQQDRFYVNWRRVRLDHEYPRFSDHAGAKGLGSIAQERFAQFQDFLRDEIGRQVLPRRVELAKIDLFGESKHWHGFDDLGVMLPLLRPFVAFAKGGSPSFAVRFDQPRVGGSLSVALGTAAAPTLFPSEVPAVRLEARVALDAEGPTVGSRLAEANVELNNVFSGLIPADERKRRFQGAS